MKIVTLDGLTQAALIIPCTTGVFYLQQCGGTQCLQRQLEGVLVPVNYDYLLKDHSHSLEYRLMSLFEGVNPWRIDQGIAAQIQQMLDSTPFTRDIKIDFGRLDESEEAWLHVTVAGALADTLSGFGEVHAVLTWPNSD